jgi:hypothetical protein
VIVEEMESTQSAPHRIPSPGMRKETRAHLAPTTHG